MILLVINDTIYQYFPDSDNVTHKVIATLTTCDTETTFKGIQPRKMFKILNLCKVGGSHTRPLMDIHQVLHGEYL